MVIDGGRQTRQGPGMQAGRQAGHTRQGGVFVCVCYVSVAMAMCHRVVVACSSSSLRAYSAHTMSHTRMIVKDCLCCRGQRS